MNKKRLLQIADDVMATKPKQFDMAVWKHDLGCGTACCAIGAHCTLHPRAPLKLRRNAWGELVPKLTGYGIRESLRRYLEISEDDVDYLFTADAYVGLFGNSKDIHRRTVASRIRNFVKNNGKHP